MMRMKSNIVIVGLGYVGLTLAVYLARSGLQVHGVEISERILQSLSQKKAHFFEQNFNDELATVIDNGSFTFGVDYLNTQQPITYIITVGTPLNKSQSVNLN